MISRENILELKTRREIHQFILQNPGLHLREISRKMIIPKTTLKYHLDYLAKQSLVSVKLEDGYKRYFVTNKLGKKEKEILNLLRQEVPRNIIIYHMFFIISSQAELSKALEKHPSTIGFHLKKLKDLGILKSGWSHNSKIILKKNIIITRNKVGSEIIYYLSENELFYMIYNLFIIYKDSLPNQDFMNEILNFVNDLVYLDKSEKKIMIREWLPNKKINNPNIIVNKTIEMLYDIFPHPYHL